METTEGKDWRTQLFRGLVIPALPLALEEDGSWSRSYQRALLRYYRDAGAGGVAVGVHSTQFAIRDPSHGLFEPVLRFASEVLHAETPENFVRIAGICGATSQAEQEATLARELGYHAGLLALTSFRERTEKEALEHARVISETLPLIGFYLQPAVGGRRYGFEFWKRFCEIPNLVAIKVAPFDRYATGEVVRAVIESGREDIALYTGNDDHIIGDLLTPFRWKGKTRHFVGGLLGQWGVWTKRAVELLEKIQAARETGTLNSEWWTEDANLTDANAAVFDAANGFAGCIPGILEVLRRQGLVPSRRCLDPKEALSPGQSEALDRVIKAYPEWTDDEFVTANRDRWLRETE